jgi:hypothetical protein
MNTARALTTRLAELLRHEHSAMADFLVAITDFDRARHWESLGYKSLFWFLHRELGLSKSAPFYRKTAAELIGEFPEVLDALRDGRLCVTSVAELAKVITRENRAEVLPREGGGICGSTCRVELDHIEPFAKGGRIRAPEEGRILCHRHQDVSARQAFGDRWMNRFTRRRMASR